MYIHDIFQNGLPADFRLVGATTRSPQDLPPALRSRCMEIYFRPLLPEEIGEIADNAVKKIGFAPCPEAVDVIKRYATNGREAVNIIQLAADWRYQKNGMRLQLPISSGSSTAARFRRGLTARFRLRLRWAL